MLEKGAIGWAAAVGVVAALGVGGAVWHYRRSVPPEGAPAPLAEPAPAASNNSRQVAAATPAAPDARPIAEAPAPAQPAPAVSSPTPKQPEPSPEAELLRPQFDIVRIEPTGEAVIAGHSAPKAKVAVTDHGQVVAEADADEYVVLGEHARALGIVPDMLRPTCADMDAIEHAGADVIDLSLTTIARLSGAQAARLADRDALSDADRGKIVLLYGGALHNDLSPLPESARWSYAPALDAHVGGRFAAIDLVVPEFIGLDATWARLPWWPYYDKGRLGRKATLFRTGPQSFVLVFPAAAPSP